MVYRAVVLVMMALGSAVAGCPEVLALPRSAGTSISADLVTQAPAATPEGDPENSPDNSLESPSDNSPDADAEVTPPGEGESPAEAPSGEEASGEEASGEEASGESDPPPPSNPGRPWLPLGLGLLGAVLTLSSGALLIKRRWWRQAGSDDDAATTDPSQIGARTANGNGTAASTAAWGEDGELAPRLLSVNIVHDLLHELASPDTTRRRQAIWELGQKGHSEAVQPLVDAMLEADSQERGLILAALAEIGVYTLKPMTRALSLSLQDASPDVRKNAIRDFTRLSDLLTQMSQLLQYASQDSDPEVQATAQWALAQLVRVAPPAQTLPPGGDTPSALPPDPS